VGEPRLEPRSARSVATRWNLQHRDGPYELVFDIPTVVVAVKSDCDGCRHFYAGEHSALANFRVILVARDAPGANEYAGACHNVYEASELLEALDVRWPPFYVVVAPSPSRVVHEGIAFTPEQVADEIASALGDVTAP